MAVRGGLLKNGLEINPFTAHEFADVPAPRDAAQKPCRFVRNSFLFPDTGFQRIDRQIISGKKIHYRPFFYRRTLGFVVEKAEKLEFDHGLNSGLPEIRFRNNSTK